MPVYKVLLDSRTRVSGTPAEYEITLPISSKDVRQVRLVGVRMPKSFYHVITTWSDSLRFDDSVTPTDLTVGEGYYDPNSLAAAWTSALAAAAAPYNLTSITYSSTTNKFSYVNGSGVSIDVSLRPNTPPSLFYNGTEILMGLTSTITVGAGATVEFPSQADFSWPHYLLINIVFGTDFPSPIRSAIGRYTFYVPFTDADALEIQKMTEASDYQQVARFDDTGFSQVQVFFHFPIRNADLYIDASGIEHQLLLEVVE